MTVATFWAGDIEQAATKIGHMIKKHRAANPPPPPGYYQVNLDLIYTLHADLADMN